MNARGENVGGNVTPAFGDHDFDDLVYGDEGEGFGGCVAGGVDAGVDDVVGGFHADYLDDDAVANVFVDGSIPEMFFGLRFAWAMVVVVMMAGIA